MEFQQFCLTETSSEQVSQGRRHVSPTVVSGEARCWRSEGLTGASTEGLCLYVSSQSSVLLRGVGKMTFMWR